MSIEDLLRPGIPQEIRLGLSTVCNLRCVYCAVSQLTYHGEDMESALRQRAIDAILEMHRRCALKAVHVNGHGETTFMKGWTDVCQSLLDAGLPLNLTTNLAKKLSPQEWDVLGQMNVVMVSIDSANADVLKRMRRRVDLERIVENIQGFREAATRRNRGDLPKLRFSCGLYDKNTPYIEEFARFAVGMNAESVGFWNLTRWNVEDSYSYTDVPEGDQAIALDEIDIDELRPRVDAIRRALEVLREHEITTHIAGDLLGTLEARLKPASTKLSTATQPAGASLLPPEGMTRDCIDPWTYIEFNPNGDVRPCCAHEPIGSLRHADLPDVLNGAQARKLRDSLLTGALDQDCLNCRLRGNTPTGALAAKVKVLLEDRPSNLDVSSQLANRVEEKLKSACERLQSGKRDQAWPLVAEALAIDPGITLPNGSPFHVDLDDVMARAKYPLTLTWLAAVCREVGNYHMSRRMLQRYLELAPHAPDRDHVARDLALPQ